VKKKVAEYMDEKLKRVLAANVPHKVLIAIAVMAVQAVVEVVVVVVVNMGVFGTLTDNQVEVRETALFAQDGK